MKNDMMKHALRTCGALMIGILCVAAGGCSSPEEVPLSAVDDTTEAATTLSPSEVKEEVSGRLHGERHDCRDRCPRCDGRARCRSERPHGRPRRSERRPERPRRAAAGRHRPAAGRCDARCRRVESARGQGLARPFR